MKSSINKQKRIDLRISEEQKQLLERAAQLKGMSLSSYLLSNSLAAAQTDLESYQKLVLSNRDQDLFIDLLTNPPKPNPALREAMRQFQEEYESDEMEN
jgi:uncharacterized protein (DUF1778 family)